METTATETVIVECGSGHARTRQRIALANGHPTFTIGRGADADVVLDDEYAAARHVRIEMLPDGALVASDLGSVNGIVIDGKRLRGATKVPLADGRLQVGRTRVRVRTSAESLAPEKRDGDSGDFGPMSPVWFAGLGAVALSAQLGYETWLTAPTNLSIQVGVHLASALAIVATWVAVWSLLTRIMLGQWRWIRHAGIALAVGVAWTAISGIVDIAWFALSLPTMVSSLKLLAPAVGLTVLLYLHLRQASTISARRAAVTVGGAIGVMCLAGLWYSEHERVRNVSAVSGMPPRIFPQWVRVTKAQQMDKFLRSLDGLKAAADGRREKLPSADDGDDEDG